MNFKYSIFVIVLISSRKFTEATSKVEQAFVDKKLVPDILQKGPTELCNVSYPTGVIPNLGNTLSTSKTWEEPKVEWTYEPDAYYTLAMIDPDGPTPQEPKWREIQHLIAGNIHRNNVTNGDYVTAYLRPRPPPGSDAHRYVFLVFKQPGLLTFDEKRIQERSPERFNFSISKFTKKYNLDDPICGNFFYAKHEE